MKRWVSFFLHNRGTIVAAAWIGYGFAFLAFAPAVGLALGPLTAVPIILSGIFYGTKGGLAAGVASAPVNVALIWAAGVGVEPMRSPGWIAGTLTGVAVGAIVGGLRDLSVRYRAEVKRRERAERQREELAGLLVHDLKNPLTVIMGVSDTLQSLPGLAGEDRAALRDVYAAAETMHRMILDLLDVSRSEEGNLVARPQRVALSESLEAIAAAMARRAEQTRQRIVVAPSPGAAVRADPELLRRTLQNLVDNAIKYSPAGGTIYLEARPPEDGFVEIRVRDEGPGIPPEFREKVFDKYVRLDRDAPRSRSGRGLGLTFCRMATDAQGGRIWVEENAPRGSSFCVRLPAAEQAVASMAGNA